MPQPVLSRAVPRQDFAESKSRNLLVKIPHHFDGTDFHHGIRLTLGWRASFLTIELKATLGQEGLP